ncbi:MULTISPECIES: hypothetical protein [Streptomyces]|uniref:hypothetical protein n=1 Tax=Streptomyces TaxID=1883 RepID=UPI0006812BA6|nr:MULTISPECIES: hypothetical protein [Streptomyces]MZE79732.1 hypothetical protein [Streptomyces sp. SID5475]
MSTQTLQDLGPALVALRLLAVDYAGLPAPCVSVSTVYPDRLELSFHDDLAGFEAWRGALGIEPERVTYHEHRCGTRVLTVNTGLAGADVVLVGYGRAARRREGTVQ